MPISLATFLKTVSRLLLGPILSLEAMILILKNVPDSALSSKAANRKQIGTHAFSNLVVKRYVSYFMPDPTDLFGLNFCSGHSEVLTAHKESLRTPVQLYSGLILLCEIEF